jgi:hypothetical protein
MEKSAPVGESAKEDVDTQADAADNEAAEDADEERVAEEGTKRARKSREEVEDEQEVEDAEDAPRRKKKARRTEADDDEEAEPAQTPQKKARNWATIAGMAGIGCLMLFVVCGATGGLGWWIWAMVRPGPSIVGRWESTTPLPLGNRMIYQFDEGGKGNRQDVVLKGNSRPLMFSYKFEGKHLVITPDDQPKGLDAPGFEVPKDFKFTARYTVTFDNPDQMTLIGGTLPVPMTFRRVK